METIIKSILSIFLAIILVFISVGVIGATNDANAVDAYLQNCSAELQVSNFNASVIEDLQEEALNNGYVLRVDVKRDSYGDALYALIEIDYTYSMPLIGLESSHTKRVISR